VPTVTSKSLVAFAVLAGLVPAAPAAAQVSTTPAAAPWRARVYVNGLFAPSSVDFSETRTFTEFAEQGRFDAQYAVDKGPGFEAGVQYNFTRQFGAAASFALASRDATGSFDADLPHPLYFDRSRALSGELTGLSYKETALHLSLVYNASSGSLDFFLFGGGSLIKVETDLLQEVRYSQSYPYDEVTLTGTPTLSVSDRPFGFHIGAALDYRLGKSFGLGAQARFSRATAKLAPEGGSTIQIDAGGFDVAAGVRVYF
jgi:opacity protein-like surface antigen